MSGARTAGRWLAAALPLIAACGGEEPAAAGPDDPLATMEFDSMVAPPRVPQPTDLAIDPATGRIDLSIAGVEVPADCAAQGAMPVAQCELDQYLEALDGYPTLGPATAPASTALAPDRLAGNVVVLDRTEGRLVDDAAVSFDAAANQLVVTPAARWDVGSTYVIAVRGYGDGVTTASGGRVVAAPATFLLKQPTSLTCGATRADAIAPDCGYVPAAEAILPPAVVPGLLVTLEAERQRLAKLDAWGAVERAGVPIGDVAVLWSFPVHTSPVAELDPSSGRVPRVVSASELRIGFAGAIDPATVTPWKLGAKGTVFLLDLTALGAAVPDTKKGVPAFHASIEGQELVLASAAPLAAGHQIGVLVTSGVASPTGAPLVPSPVTVLLRATGPLVDASGRSNVAQVGDADAAKLEAGRAELAKLLDDALFAAMTGLERRAIAYVYAFEMPAP
jgi:hypothetical protein